MELYFATKNRYKFEEVKSILDKYNIVCRHTRLDKLEPKDMELSEVALMNAKEFYKKLKKPVAVEDTGIFFRAYPNFPGSHPKLMFNLLGYKGLLKLLEGEDRRAEFKSVIGFCDGDVRLFEGKLEGEISTKVHDREVDVMPYERIFLHNGKPLSMLTRKEKNSISHRSRAFTKLALWLKKV